MHFIKSGFIGALLTCILCATAFSQQRVVVIGLDGFGAEGYKAARHPNMDKLFADGVLSLTTRPVMPSVTLPNWTSHLTGSGPEEHGVTSNTWTVTNRQLMPIDSNKNGYYPSIFQVLEERVPKVRTAFYYNWAELINAFDKKYIDEVSFQWNDRYDSNYHKAFDFLVENKDVPTFVFLYTVHIDHAGHKYGWMSPPYINAIEAADTAIGIFLDKLKDAHLYESTHFILIADHGGIGTGHGGTSMHEMQVPWAVEGRLIKKKGLQDFYNSNKNTALVIAKIFEVSDLPKSWTGVVPEGIFK